jgi:hypothetical protein
LNMRNVVSPKHRLYDEAKPTVRKADDAAGRGMQKKRRPGCNGMDRAAVKQRYPPRKRADFCEANRHERT